MPKKTDNTDDNNNKKTNWFLRLQGRNMAALKNSLIGIVDTIKTEPSFWQELVVIIPLIVVSFFLDVSAVEQALMVVSLLLIILTELINTAIEATIDRISLERHDYFGFGISRVSFSANINSMSPGHHEY